MSEVTVPAWALVVVLALLLAAASWCLVLVSRGRTRTRLAFAKSRAEAAVLRARVDEVERRLSEDPAVPEQTPDYVITRLWDEPEPVPTVAAPVFADLVLRESVVQAAALTAGLRRALAPQVRHRIRFEMRREVKRARKQRRADLRVARREWEARQRGQGGDQDIPSPGAARGAA